MRHLLLATLLATAATTLSAATVSGSVSDPSGAIVPNAKMLLFDPDTAAKFETTTGADGTFSFDSVPAGQYILRTQSPGFASLFREFDLKAKSKLQLGLSLSLGKLQETVVIVAQGKPRKEEPKQLRVGGNVAEAKLITKIAPIYPPAARATGMQGQVTLETVTSKEGVPINIRVMSSSGDLFTQSALQAVRQWRYKPTRLNGEPVEVVTEIVIKYELSN